MTYQDYQAQQSKLKSIKDFSYPVLKDVDLTFSVLRTNTQLLELAKAEGFYNSDTPYNRLVSSMFFRGGQVHFKKDLDEDRKTLAWRYFKALMHSFEPQHEEKEAIGALILSELAEV